MSYDDGCREAAARIRELEAAYAAKMKETRYVAAERDAAQHLSAQQERHRDELLAENERLRKALTDIRNAYLLTEREYASMEMDKIAANALGEHT